ncbi:sulfate/molybdate ABC transporter ATP-binding protein [Demequina activiva]|uniref:Molybdenum ABC transporter ATP-binding protein n=1 Tax=Demequina activiva TaxID=1582364 RepID=A0A919UGP2_9MICO|nr:ATP-binding cassette domain-containing protein [Demequina activiva]GIG55047.1 molybdenum ABC transporter ATP-binding protein [Demequina activiva]
MSLDARISVDERGVDAALTVPHGETLALLGPNGSGKSTVLAAIAGTLRPQRGHARLDERTLHALDRDMPAQWRHPRERRIGLVTQRADLFPALPVIDNIAYGLRARGLSRGHAREEARSWLARADLLGLADRRPTTLSAGQARRVAIVRALAAQPDALMLDEPFAGVDVEAAQQLRALVAEQTRSITTVIATHEVLDAHLLASQVAVLAGGAVVEAGSTATVLTRPRTEFAAAMAGRILLRGEAQDGALVTPDGARLPANTSEVARGASALVAISPLEVRIATAGQRADLTDTVRLLEPRGDLVRVTGATLAADVAPHQAAGLAVGADVGWRVTAPPVAYAA